eukprot:jgi/Psemu1/292326/fgenesh1_pg.1006_\
MGRGPTSTLRVVCNDNTTILHCGPWATAIQEATAYAFFISEDDPFVDGEANSNATDERRTRTRTNKQHGPSRENRNPDQTNEAPTGTNNATPLDRVECSLGYLETLKELLEQQENWEWVPYPCHPPSFHRLHGGDDGGSSVNGCNNKENKKYRAGSYDRSNITRSGSESSTAETTTTTTTTTATAAATATAKKKTKLRVTSNGTSQSSHHGRIWIDSKNRYASFASEMDSDSDEEEEEENGEEENGDDDDEDEDDDGEEDSTTEAKSKVKPGQSIHHSLSASAIPYDPEKLQEEQFEMMDTIRLLIRLHASQSDLYAKKARLLATNHRWLPGAGALQSSIVALAQGLDLADAAISKTLAATAAAPTVDYNHGNYTKTDHRMGQLERDAEITSVSSCYLVYEKDRYLKAAHKQATKLESILKPMWERRDQARRRLGNNKWVHNNKSKGYYAKMRLQHEREFYALEQALEQLEDSQTDASSLVNEASRLREKLKDIKYAQNRYNGKRKSYPQGATEAVEFGLPVQYGWTFTGSLDRGGEDCVEFYEKWVGVGSSSLPPPPLPDAHASGGIGRVDSPSAGKKSNLASTNGNINIAKDEQGGEFVLVKLDVHYVTGAVRTVVHYPARYDASDGSLLQPEWKSPQYFPGSSVGPGLYHCILANPLSTTEMGC